MVISMAPSASEADLQHVIARIRECGLQPYVVKGEERTIVAVVGVASSQKGLESFRAAPGVDDVIQVSHPFKLVSSQTGAGRTRVKVGSVFFGGEQAVVIAGPCSVESYEQLLSTAKAVRKAGAVMLRGGAYKPRTSPYDFQGLGVEALRLLAQVGRETGLPVVTEVMSTDHIQLVADHADMFQVGARNMQNYDLLRQLASAGKPILLKRGPAATLKEWLLAAEYLLAGGNCNVVLCERGIRTFETETRNTLDLAGVALARSISHLPVIVDPSHATGRRDLIAAASRAAIAIGADGLLIEVHPNPEKALSDGSQSVNLEEFALLMDGLSSPLRPIAAAYSARSQYA